MAVPVRGRGRLVRPFARFFSRRVLFADRFLYATPAAFGLDARDVEIEASGGRTLRGLVIEGTRPGTIVFCPGNSGNLSSHIEYVKILERTGYSILGFDYGGFGRSDGEAHLATLVTDGEAAFAFAAARARGAPVGLFGISLGACAALAAAGRGARDAAGVAVEGVSDLYSMLEGLLLHGSFGPVRAAPGSPRGSLRERRPRAPLWWVRLPPFLASLFARVSVACYPFEGKSLPRIARALGPKPALVIHGAEDSLLPFEASIDLHLMLEGPKALWLIPDMGHAQEPAAACGCEYTERLGRFFEAAFAGAFRAGEESVSVPPGAHPDDRTAARYREGGYAQAFRRMAVAVNSRNLAALDAALGEHLSLEREHPFDFLAALYAVRAAQAALGQVPSWRAHDRASARRSCERFTVFWATHPGLPGEDTPESPAAWVRRVLDAER
ncbi:MAG TPA: alpha/beta fold hydrolase [Planctomycetota bacterium]|nr:alpha/beta fold hydrolase [Planctomycetota bacterium]